MGALSDRIGDLEPKGKYENEDWATGFYAGTEEAANLAKEADELMEEMAEVLDVYADERYISLPARQVLNKYYKYKEQNQ